MENMNRKKSFSLVINRLSLEKFQVMINNKSKGIYQKDVQR